MSEELEILRKLIEVAPEHIGATKRKELYKAVFSELDLVNSDLDIAKIYDIDDTLDQVLVEIYPDLFEIEESDSDESELDFDESSFLAEDEEELDSEEGEDGLWSSEEE